MRQLFIFIISLLPLSVYAKTIFTQSESKSVTFDEITSTPRQHFVEFTVNYSISPKISGRILSSCWSSLEEMKDAVNSNGISPNSITYQDGMLNIQGSDASQFEGGNHSIIGTAYLNSTSAFENKVWDLYCTFINSETSFGRDIIGGEPFHPNTLTYTVIKLHASSEAYPHISAPAIIDLNSCLPNDNLEAAIPVNVGFVGHMGQSKRMELAVKSKDLPAGFSIFLDNKNILNTPPQLIQMPAGQKEKQIETHLQGKCPNKVGEHVWNAEYITTIQ